MPWTVNTMTGLVALIDDLPLHSTTKLKLFQGASFADVAQAADEEGLVDAADKLRSLSDQGLQNPNRHG